MSPNLTRLHVWRALIYGLMATLGLIGLVTLVWAAVPSGSSVLYTSTDTVVMPVGTTFTGQTLGVLGPFIASGSMALAGALTPPQLTANQNDYNPANLATANLLRLSTDAPRDLTGLAGGTLGRIMTLHNVGTQNLVIRAENTNSAAANRLAMPSDLVLPANGMIVIQYDVTSARWRTIAPQLTGGTLNGALLTLQQQAGDGSPAPAGTVVVYAKTDGNVFARDPAGNVKDLVNAGGGGGGGTGVGLTARFITTTNMDLVGEETIEGILTSSSRVFVAGQTNPNQNGIYITQSGAWTRTSDALAGASFASGTIVTISDGIAGAAGNKGTCWTYLTSGSYNTSALTAIKTCWGPSAAAFEQLVNKGAVSGYPSLDADQMLTWTQSGSRATHAAVAAPGTITPTATTMGVEGSGTPPVVMGAGDPRITGCTAPAHHGRKLTLKGSHLTQTLTIPNGQGVRLCGNTGSLVLGLDRQSADFVCEGLATPKEWQQIGCGDLQQAKNVNGTITGANDLASAVKVCDTPNGNCLNLYGSTIQGTQAGASIDHVVNIPAGKSLILQGAGVTYETISAAGGHAFLGVGKLRKAIEFDAGAITTDGTCVAPTEQVLNGAGSPKTWAFSCGDSNSSIFYGKVSMKRSGWDGGPVRFLLTVLHPTTETITFAGDFSAMCRRPVNTVDANWSSGVAANVAITTANRTAFQETTDVTPNGSCAPGDMIFWRYVVNAGTFSTNAANTKVLTVTMSYLLSTPDGAQE